MWHQRSLHISTGVCQGCCLFSECYIVSMTGWIKEANISRRICVVCRIMSKKVPWPLDEFFFLPPPVFPISLQVSHLFGLALFEDYLFATCSEPSRESKVDIFRINRFNSSDTNTIATLESARNVRVYHRLAQPTGKLVFRALLNTNSNLSN